MSLSLSFSFLVKSYLLITLITGLKGHRPFRVLYGSVFQQCAVESESLSDKVTQRAVSGTAKFCSSSLTWRISQYKDNTVFCCVCLLKYYLTFPVETAPHFYVNAICLQKRKLLTGEMKTSSQINISKVMFFPQSYFQILIGIYLKIDMTRLQIHLK